MLFLSSVRRHRRSKTNSNCNQSNRSLWSNFGKYWNSIPEIEDQFKLQSIQPIAVVQLREILELYYRSIGYETKNGNDEHEARGVLNIIAKSDYEVSDVTCILEDDYTLEVIIENIVPIYHPWFSFPPQAP